MIKRMLEQRKWKNTKELFLKKKEIKTRLENVLDTIESKGILEEQDMKNVRNEVNNINSIRRRTNKFERNEIGQYIQEETFNLLNERLKNKPIEYKKYVVEVLEYLI